MGLSTLSQVFVQVITFICQVVTCISRPLPNKTKLKFDDSATAVALFAENTNEFSTGISFVCSNSQLVKIVVFFAKN